MKLRKIIVEDNVYLYKCITGLGLTTEIATFEITVFLQNYRQTALKISFITWEDLYAGNPLNTGINLTKLETKEKEVVNLNRPKYVRECILYGLRIGWNGKNKVESIDGLEILKSLGYDFTFLYPKEGSNMVHGKEYIK